MSSFVSRAALVLLALLVVSCGNEPAPNVDALQFPVVLLFGNASARLCQERGELLTMHTNYIVLGEGNPVLIDSQFKVYELEHFRSTHSSLWLMANPSGPTDVTFDMKPAQSSAERARELFARHLAKQTWLHDVEARRKSLAAKQTLLEMFSVLENEPGNLD